MYPVQKRPEYPPGGLMQLRDFVKDGELRNPTMLGPDGEECLIVVKKWYHNWHYCRSHDRD